MSNSLFTISEILPMIIFATFTLGIGVAIHFLNRKTSGEAPYIAPEPKDRTHEKALKPVPIDPKITQYTFDEGGTREIVVEQTAH